MVELESEGELSRRRVAAFLRTLANELDDESSMDDRDVPHEESVDPDEAGDAKRITFVVGGDSATVTVPERVDFEVEVESRSPMFTSGVSQEIELELSWRIDEADEDLHADRVEIG